MQPSAAAVTASSPKSAPLGTMICPPRAFASSINSGRGNSAPTESTITLFPASSIGRQIPSSMPAGVHSIARSARAGNSAGPTKGHVIRSAWSQASAFAWSRTAAQANTNPGMPAESSRTTTRPMTMIIPFAAGGPTDVLGRIMGQRMSEILGQQVVVENIGGAGGMTGSKRVADAAPDGYAFVLGTVGTHAQSQTMYKKPLYHAATECTPVALIAEVPIVLITRKDLPVNNLQQFISYAKANQTKMQYGSA